MLTTSTPIDDEWAPISTVCLPIGETAVLPSPPIQICYVESRGAMKTVGGPLIHLIEGDSGGLFLRRQGVQPYLDPTQGIFVPHGDGVSYWERDCTGDLLPCYFGAPKGKGADCTKGVQALFDFVRKTYNNTRADFDYQIDFGGRMWEVRETVHLANLRQPGLVMKNGGLYGRCLGEAVLELPGVNVLTMMNVHIRGDRLAQPTIGILCSRSEHPAGSHQFGGSPNIITIGLQISGYFSQAGMINYACEVSSAYGLSISNLSRVERAAGYIAAGHIGNIEDWVGVIECKYAILPRSFNQSNILHNLSSANINRSSDVAMPILGISRSNPCVVFVSPTALVKAGLHIGFKVFFHDLAGMIELAGNSFPISNIDETAGTFELTGVDATAFSAWTGGGMVWAKTGPAVIIGQGDAIFCRASYFLSYGSAPLVIDLKYGAPRMIDLEFQPEALAASAVKIRFPASGMQVMQGLRLHILAAQNNFSHSVVSSTGGAGQVRIDGCDIKVYNMGVAPPYKVFDDPARYALSNFKVEMPLSAALNDFSTGWANTPTGYSIAHDRAPAIVQHGF